MILAALIGPMPSISHMRRAGLEAIGVEPEGGQDDAGTDAAGPGRAGEPAATRPSGATEAAIGSQADRDAADREAAPAARTAAPAGKTREGSKQALLVDILKRPEGATVGQIVEATGWQPHTVRGALAGALKKRLGSTVVSEKVEGRGRVYRIAG